ncbi:hypothetical protein AB664_00560 [Brucella anthropi]|uniref:Uncharacterized protein n=1 Tax=Brucella anthropi TaxID=529 RepID=A0A656Z5C3_BRUAN|nr:hypothetical protein AB664_00560 [Brucella anthropi]
MPSSVSEAVEKAQREAGFIIPGLTLVVFATNRSTVTICKSATVNIITAGQIIADITRYAQASLSSRDVEVACSISIAYAYIFYGSGSGATTASAAFAATVPTAIVATDPRRSPLIVILKMPPANLS